MGEFVELTASYGHVFVSYLAKPEHILPAAIDLTHGAKTAAVIPAQKVFTYSATTHGFNCDSRSSCNPQAVKLAEDRTLTLFANMIG